jgi:hypothetical protein
MDPPGSPDTPRTENPSGSYKVHAKDLLKVRAVWAIPAIVGSIAIMLITRQAPPRGAREPLPGNPLDPTHLTRHNGNHPGADAPKPLTTTASFIETICISPG